MHNREIEGMQGGMGGQGIPVICESSSPTEVLGQVITKVFPFLVAHVCNLE